MIRAMTSVVVAFSSTHTEKSRNGLIQIVAPLSVLRCYGEERCNLGRLVLTAFPLKDVSGHSEWNAPPPSTGGGGGEQEGQL